MKLRKNFSLKPETVKSLKKLVKSSQGRYTSVSHLIDSMVRDFGEKKDD